MNIAWSDVRKMVRMAFLGKEDAFVPKFVNRRLWERARAMGI